MASEGKRAVAFRDWAEDVLYEVMTKGNYGKQKQLSELDTHIKASRFFQNKITEGKKAGLSRQDAVLRAYTAAFEQTGCDFSDALPENFKSSPFIPGTITEKKALERFISECCETGKNFKKKPVNSIQHILHGLRRRNITL